MLPVLLMQRLQTAGKRHADRAHPKVNSSLGKRFQSAGGTCDYIFYSAIVSEHGDQDFSARGRILWLGGHPDARS